MDYEYTSLYYNGLVQVKFYDASEKRYRAALCYHNKLVDARNGDEYLIDNIIQRSAEDGIHFDDAIVECSWNDLTSKILQCPFV